MEIPAGDWGAQFRWSFTDLACQRALTKHRSAMAALKIVYDNDGLWDWGDPNGDGPEHLHKMVDQYADAGAKGIVWGCGNNTAWSYTPKAQEAWCDRVPADNQDHRALASRFRAWLDAGTDPLAVVLERAKARKLSVLAGFRLNRFMPKFGMESWFEKNSYVILSAASCPMYPTQQSANLALPEVREHFVAGFIDVVERYEVDGLHLEFMRAVPFVTMLDVALRGVGNMWDDVIIPGFDHLVVENTLGKFGKQVEVFTRIPVNVQHYDGQCRRVGVGAGCHVRYER